MKVKKSTLTATATIATILITQSAHAFLTWGFLQNCTGWNYCAPYQYLVCAPEVQEGNIKATERVLNTFAQGELKGDKEFTAIVQTISKLPTNQKIAAYFAAVGIKSEQDAVEFVSSREANPKYVKSLASNTNISEEKASLVASAIARALLGEQQ